MTFHRRGALAAAVLLAISGGLTMVAFTPAAAAQGEAQYCIARGGSNGESASYVGNCIYSDYQQCLQAAAGGGNCVQNIDYHAGATTTPGAPRARRRR